MTEEQTLYSGRLTKDMYDEVSEAVSEFSTEWIDAEVDVILESNGQDRLRVEGPETSSLLTPWKTTTPEDTYEIDSDTANYLQQTFQ